MNQRNYIVFIVLSMAVLLGWNTLVLPRLMPRKPVVAKDEANKSPKADDQKLAAQKPADRNPTDQKSKDQKSAGTKDETSKSPKPAANTDKEKSAVAAAPSEKKAPAPALFERKTVVLGSDDPQTGFFIRAELSSQGAVVSTIEFNDPRYRELKNTKIPLKVVGNDLSKFSERTFGMEVPQVDAQLVAQKMKLTDVDWSVVDVKSEPIKTADGAKPITVNTSATFRYPSPDGQLIIEKRYSLSGVKPEEDSQYVRDTTTSGYLLHLDVTIRNAGSEKATASYILQGPVGVPLENADNTKKYRDVKMGYLTADGAVTAGKQVTIAKIIEGEDKNQPEQWKSPLKYIGVDVQYFAALIEPLDDQLKNQTIERSMPMTLDRPAKPQFTDLSVRLESKPIELAPQQSVTQKYELFAGPKRRDLLQSLQAEAVLDFGWFAVVSHVMLALLKSFYNVGIPYGFGIICLTVLVRACLFPITLRTTAQAQRMKEMQPKLAELKKKYANDREKMAMAQMQLMREYKVNPLGGCLPLFLQLPIFIGLYQALNYAVDLRLAPFLYFNNLAGPDALFHLPFALPWLGSDFNLLPLITVALFVVQQKMFMPPPTDEQQEMQYKMMNIMMVFMGFLYYTVPAGLCIYFISSSLWGIGERKILNWWKERHPAAAPGDSPTAEEPIETPRVKSVKPSAKETAGAASGPGSLWQRLLDAADSAGAQGTSGTKQTGARRESSSGKKNGRKSR